MFHKTEWFNLHLVVPYLFFLYNSKVFGKYLWVPCFVKEATFYVLFFVDCPLILYLLSSPSYYYYYCNILERERMQFFKVMDQDFDMITWLNFYKNPSGFSTFISQRNDHLVLRLPPIHLVGLWFLVIEILDYVKYFKSSIIFTSRMQKSSLVNFWHLVFFLNCLFD